jgi:hypothetical protein
VSDTPQLLLAHHLKALKLPTFLREYDKLAQQCAAEGVDHPRYLLRLAELELIEREQRMVERRIRDARFPTVKSLDSFDFTAIPSLNKTLVLELARGEYIARRENAIAVGNSGTGKTHIALGLGLAACQKGLSVGFTTAAAIVHVSTDLQYWTLFAIKNWTPGLNGCPETQTERLVQVVHRRDPRAAQRPPRVRRRGAREVLVDPPGQAPGHACAGTLDAMAGAFNKPLRRFSRSR